MRLSFAVAICMLFSDISAVNLHTKQHSLSNASTAQHQKEERMGQIRLPIVKSEGSVSDFLKRKQSTQMTQISTSSSEELGQVDLELDNSNNYSYKCILNIGSPPQPVRAIMDTGSSNAWILSNKAVSASEAEKHQTYNPEESSTYVGDNSIPDADISFGSGDLSGYFGYDLVTLGDPNDEDSLKVQSQSLGVVADQNVFSSQFDAIVGLAYPGMAEDGTKPLMDTMMDEGVLANNLFAFYMSMNPDKEPSELVFGHIDEDRYDGDIYWHDVQHQLFWNLKLDDIKINGESLNICDGVEDCFITPDSGTTFLTAPMWAMQAIKDKTYSGECESDMDFGDLTYVIEGVEYSIPSNHWMQKKIGQNDFGWCDSVISVLDIGMPRENNLFIVGDVFMQIWYSIFDRDNNRVGLAKAHHNEDEWNTDQTYNGTFIEVDDQGNAII